MNKDKLLKKIIIFFTILVLIILIVIITVKIYINKNIDKEIAETGSDIIKAYGKSTNGKIDSQSYFDVKYYMQKYLDTINIKNTLYGYYDEQNNYIQKMNQKEIKQKIYNLLSSKYINKKNITMENLYDHINVLQEQSIFVPIEIALIRDSKTKSFLVYGLVESSKDYSVIQKIFSVVNFDFSQYSFSIELIDGDYTSINEIKIEQFEDTVTSNNNNRFSTTYIKAEEFSGEYIKIFKGLAFGDPERLYNLLDKDYRKAKFDSLDDFKDYIEKNKYKIMSATLDSYKIDVIEDGRRHICTDRNGNYYIINQKQFVVDYTMMLDAYTINLPELSEKYDSLLNNQKGIFNIKKLTMAAEQGDYKYLYKKLNESFRNTNFKTLEEFEKFISKNYDVNDTIEYEEYEEIAGVYAYNVKITNNKKGKTTQAQIIVRLKENRDFEFSFSVKN